MDQGQTGRRGADRVLKEIKDESIVLTIASRYVCEPPILKKIGATLAERVQSLKRHVAELEQQFVGRPAEELRVDAPLEELERFAELLQRGGKRTYHRCTEGNLGRELSDKLTAVSRGIQALEEKVEGSGVRYRARDAAKEVLGRVGTVSRPVAATSRLLARLVLLGVILCMAIFLFLFVTMEKEPDVLREITRMEQELAKKRSALPELNQELRQIEGQIDTITDDEEGRSDNIQLMDLNLRAHQLSERREKTQIEIQTLEQDLAEHRERLAEMRRQSLLERLLRF